MVIVQSVPIIEARFGGNNSVTINARNFGSSPTETEMEIHLKNITGPGTYQLNQNTAVYPNESASYAHFVRRRVRPMEEWITNSQLGGSVTITKFDPENKIISGIFEFQAANILGGSAPITVTDGRFDVRIQ